VSEGLEVRENHKSPIQIPFCFGEYSRTPIVEIFSQVLSSVKRSGLRMQPRLSVQ